MKKTLLFIVVLFTINLSAQVTIGSAIKPNEGAILDLKENDNLGANSTKGLALPRVQLTTISSLNDISIGLDKDDHIGLTIYVPKAFEQSCPGVYVWDGEVWQGINTDASRAPEYITVDDIDGNTYQAKLFNRNGCTGGVYWMTSNLRVTRKNDGTPFHKPLYFHAGRAITYVNPAGSNPIQEFNEVTQKSDISTTKTINFYQNDQLVTMTHDDFVTKFGLQYTYYMAFANPDNPGETDEDKKICPEGWVVPSVEDWQRSFLDVTGDPNSFVKSAFSLFPNDDYYEAGIEREVFWDPTFPLEDTRIVVSPDISWNVTGNNYISVFSKLVTIPRKMGGYPKGNKLNSGLNVLPAGYKRGALDTHFGSGTAMIEKRNGAMSITAGNPTVGGGWISEFQTETIYGSIRCIKVVE